MKAKSSKIFKIIVFLLCFLFCFEQTGFAQVAGELDISGHIAAFRNSLIIDKFRPLHLRSLSYDHNLNNFKLLLDKGDLKNPKKPDLKNTIKILLNYFFVGLTLPNDTFWINLRPDSEDNIIDPDLARTDVGKILLEADLQLKKDTARFTSPETKEGRDYWDKLYRKAGELLGSENITIPTLTRPWIVPGEIIIRETKDTAYIYKATLKVMLEQDYLKDSATYKFDDPRLKTLNEYSSQLIRDLIIPKLTKEVNTSKRYAPLRQVYYSLILAQWFKARFYGKGGLYSWLIDKENLRGLTSVTHWNKTTYFKEYQKSFKDGEYNLKEPIYTPYGQTVRSYFSGGLSLSIPILPEPPVLGKKPVKLQQGQTEVVELAGDAERAKSPLSGNGIAALVFGSATLVPSETKVTITKEASSPILSAKNQPKPGASLTSAAGSPTDQKGTTTSSGVEGEIRQRIIESPTVEELYASGKLRRGWKKRTLPAYLSFKERVIYDNEDFGLHLEARDKVLYEDDTTIVVFTYGSTYFFLTYHWRGKQAYLVAMRFKDNYQLDDGGLLNSSVWQGAKAEGITPTLIAMLLEKEGLPFRDFLIEKLNVPKLSDDARRQQEEYELDLEKLKDLIEKTKEYRTRYPREYMQPLWKDAKTVFQHEYAVTNRQSGMPRYLQTFGADTCFILTIYDLDSKTAALAHIDATTDINLSIRQMLAKMNLSIQQKKLAARIIGGYQSSSTGEALELIKVLEAHSVEIVEVALKKKAEESDSIIFDSETGEVFNMKGDLSWVKNLKDSKIRSLQSELAAMQGKTSLRFVEGFDPFLTTGGELEQSPSVLDPLRQGLPEDFPRGVIENIFDIQFHNIIKTRYGAYGIRIPFSSDKLSKIEELKESLEIKYPQLSFEIKSYGENKFYLQIAQYGYKAEEDQQVVVQINNVAANIWEELKDLKAGSPLINKPNKIETEDNLRGSSLEISASSAVEKANSISDKGGVDFRVLPTITQPMNMPAVNLGAMDVSRLSRINLDSEWSEIQNILKAGIIPSNERIKEYLLASCLNQNLGKEMDKVLGCIADILRLEEERVLETDSELKTLLVLIESGKPEGELQLGLSQITISPKEPKLVVP